jgi:4-alpha-glucanotransferase
MVSKFNGPLVSQVNSSRSTSQSRDPLEELAELWGVQTSYEDVSGKCQLAAPDSLLAVLSHLGAPVANLDDVPQAVREWHSTVAVPALEPVTIVWNGLRASANLRVALRNLSGSFAATIAEENGSTHRWTGRLDQLPNAEAKDGPPSSTINKVLAFPADLSLGYHRLSVEIAGQQQESLLVSAPVRAYSPRGKGWQRSWGTFLPLHALRSDRSWGAGDFADLRDLRVWIEDLGGSIVGTLPLLAAFLDEPFEVSPYSPVSRLFWNEFYLNIAEIPEVTGSEEARRLLESADTHNEIERLQKAPLVDYRRPMALKRPILEALAKSFFSSDTRRRREFEQHASHHAYLEDYAVFRAFGERLRKPWSEWPESARDRTEPLTEFSENAKRYHMYVQWLAEQQLEAAAGSKEGCGLYLDLPLGVNANGYDVWRARDLFAVGVAGGCPPDIVFPHGQNWGFVPLHPKNIRRDGYQYVRDFVRHQMRHANVLRIDHMPSFHRIFWIPPGASAKDGVYVRYPAEELYAVFALESHRHRTMVVGEDLGTVPPEVPLAMSRHNFHRMYVVQYEVKPDPLAALPDPPASSIASVNTHDMAPFAGFWQGTDLIEREEAGVLPADKRGEEQMSRSILRAALHDFLRCFEGSDKDEASAAYESCLAFLRDSPARIVLVNLEDLWQELRSQNVPTATADTPNWRRKARHSWEEFSRDADAVRVLRDLSSAIKGTSADPDSSFTSSRTHQHEHSGF